MKLYYSRGACSLAPHIALHESGLKFSTESVNLQTGEYQGGDYSKVNPKGTVPALEMDNGQILTEVAVVLQYIADQVPDRQLIPKAGTMERYRCQEWLNYIATEVHKGFGPFWDSDSTEEVKKATRANLEQKFEYLTKKLEGKSYLMGDQYSVADIYLFTILNWTHFLKVDLSGFPVLQGFMERVKSQKGTEAALRAEKLLR